MKAFACVFVWEPGAVPGEASAAVPDHDDRHAEEEVAGEDGAAVAQEEEHGDDAFLGMPDDAAAGVPFGEQGGITEPQVLLFLPWLPRKDPNPSHGTWVLPSATCTGRTLKHEVAKRARAWTGGALGPLHQYERKLSRHSRVCDRDGVVLYVFRVSSWEAALLQGAGRHLRSMKTANTAVSEAALRAAMDASWEAFAWHSLAALEEDLCPRNVATAAWVWSRLVLRHTAWWQRRQAAVVAAIERLPLPRSLLPRAPPSRSPPRPVAMVPRDAGQRALLLANALRDRVLRPASDGVQGRSPDHSPTRAATDAGERAVPPSSSTQPAGKRQRVALTPASHPAAAAVQ